MPMDLYKVDDHYVLTADLPGVDPGSVDVTIENGRLTPMAHRSARCEYSVQRFFGTYRRQPALGKGADTTKIAATYENSVLTMTIPLTERAKTRRIQVAHTGSATTIEPA